MAKKEEAPAPAPGQIAKDAAAKPAASGPEAGKPSPAGELCRLRLNTAHAFVNRNRVLPWHTRRPIHLLRPVCRTTICKRVSGAHN